MKLEAFREVVLESSGVEELKEKVRHPLVCVLLFAQKTQRLSSLLLTQYGR